MAEPLDERAAEDLHAEIKRALTLYKYDVPSGGQFDLWRDVFPNSSESKVMYGTIYRLESLSSAAGGWWHFPEASREDFGEGRFYSTSEWLGMNAQEIARIG